MSKRKRRNPDHIRRRNVPGPDNEVIEAQLSELLTPAISGQLAYYRQLGLRSRILTLPLMVAAVLRACFLKEIREKEPGCGLIE